jgi:hypothetical protein
MLRIVVDLQPRTYPVKLSEVIIYSTANKEEDPNKPVSTTERTNSLKET